MTKKYPFSDQLLVSFGWSSKHSVEKMLLLNFREVFREFFDQIEQRQKIVVDELPGENFKKSILVQRFNSLV